MPEIPKVRTMDRRAFLELSLGAGGLAALWLALGKRFSSDMTVDAQAATPEWPKDQEGILNKIDTLNFPRGAQLRTNFFPRKSMWEDVQLLKMQGKWVGEDESDWQAHPEIIEGDLDMLAQAGINGARLVIVPFEVTQDGQQYDWTAMDTALDMFNKRGLVASLSAGPLDYPFGPAGVRLPKKFQDMLSQEMKDRGKDHIDLSLQPNPDFPNSSIAIRDFALDYLKRFLDKYANDTRIDKFYLGNEWPDNHEIEGVQGTMKIGRDLMEEAIKLMKAATSKKIALNTNIPPSELSRLQKELGPLLDLLGEQGVLGLDPYPTQEALDSVLSKEMGRYGEHVDQVRKRYPKTEIIFTEYQAEVWPPSGVAGKPWAEIQRDHPELVTQFFQESFPPHLEDYMIKSGITEVGLYGSPEWPIAAQMGYKFPLQMLKRISDRMAKLAG
jgi:hypothetical protein